MNSAKLAAVATGLAVVASAQSPATATTRPGTFQLTVTDNGSDIYDRSASASRKLTVTR